MANEQDFKKLLDAQKETNKQLALLRQEQMQIAKDPPEDLSIDQLELAPDEFGNLPAVGGFILIGYPYLPNLHCSSKMYFRCLCVYKTLTNTFYMISRNLNASY